LADDVLLRESTVKTLKHTKKQVQRSKKHRSVDDTEEQSERDSPIDVDNENESDKESDDESDKESDDESKTAENENKVWFDVVVYFPRALITRSQRRARNDPTKDIRLCGKTGTGVHPTKKEKVEGWFCKFCL
jgi:hypothetical protein